MIRVKHVGYLRPPEENVLASLVREPSAFKTESAHVIVMSIMASNLGGILDFIFLGLLVVVIAYLIPASIKYEKKKKEKDASALLADKAKVESANLKPKSEQQIREFLTGFTRFQQSHLCLSCGYSGLVGIKVSQKVWGVRIGAFLLPILVLLQLGLGNVLILFGGIPTATVIVILYGVLLVVVIKQPRVCPNCETHHGVIS